MRRLCGCASSRTSQRHANHLAHDGVVFTIQQTFISRLLEIFTSFLVSLYRRSFLVGVYRKCLDLQSFWRGRDVPPLLFLVVLIILVMLTLSQILVVHNGRYSRGTHSIRRLQLELREMDTNLHTLMMKNVPSIELNRRLLQNQINQKRINELIEQASLQPKENMPKRLPVPVKILPLSIKTPPQSVNNRTRDAILRNILFKHTNSETYIHETMQQPISSSSTSSTVTSQAINGSRVQLTHCPSIPPSLSKYGYG